MASSMTVNIFEDDFSLSSVENKHKKTQNITRKRKRNGVSDTKKGVFSKDWLKDPKYCDFLQEVRHDPTKARYSSSNCDISVYGGGKNHLDKHVDTVKHQEFMKNKTQNSLETFFTPCTELDKLSAIEATFVFHGVKHAHSYLSQGCTVSVVKTAFPTCTIAKNMTCGRTKARSIACDVLSPYFVKEVLVGVQKNTYYFLAYGATNRGNSKVFPFVVQYSSDKGVKCGLIEVIEYPGETANELFRNTHEVMMSNGSTIEGLTALGADNTNVNFENIDIDKLYDELCEVQTTYIVLNKKGRPLHEQIQLFLRENKQGIKHDDKEDKEEEKKDMDDGKTKEEETKRIYPDRLWAHLFHVHDKPAPNLKQLISFCFSISISNGYCEGVFNHMKQAWTNTRNKMAPELTSA
ncbi:unnamed protein product [Didymodactylos carnosus]|uniref:HAT C-terminal dimerisation domain-containing protein n=1 Tax=Didymodactylos carnosus TaxID=1234261 RepID=A0A815TIJ9_9BILA|nr:unnamed protein product [Didymodactylos carnosus]CAF4366974.1 unnamed protein product [Didymodactylos carnosus]